MFVAGAAYHAGPPDLLYSSSDHQRIASLFTVQMGFMRCNAQLPPQLHLWLPPSIGFVGKAVARCYAMLIIAVSCHFSLLFAKTTYDTFYDGRLEEITDALTSFIIYTFTCFSTCYWMFHGGQLTNFLKRIDHEYRHHSLAGLSFVTSQAAYVRARWMTIIWLTSCFGGVMLWGFAPIILRSHTLPLKCWYPFDELQPFVYELIYTSQLLGQFCVCTGFANGSALYVSLVITMIGQLDVLFCSLKNFEYHARLISGMDLKEMRKLQQRMQFGQDDELNQYIFAREHKTDLSAYKNLHKTINNRNMNSKTSYETELHLALVECVNHHHFIIKCCQELEQLFSPYCLTKSLQITFQICLLLFVGVEGEQTPLRIINLIQYLSLTFVELMMFTYFGELLSSHSVRGGEALWRAAWWRSTKHIRNDIIIFLINSRRAVKLTAGKFFVMDVERLRSVVTQAFSFLTLLQKLAAKNDK